MNRRNFLRQSLASAIVSVAAKAGASPRAYATAPSSAPVFSTRNANWQSAYDKSLEILRNNVQVLPRFDKPVLIEGSEYAGIWQECGPYEALVYRKFRDDVARNSHMIFFALQRPDGQLPANNIRSGVGFGQIQMVVPIAATAWDLAQATGDQELLEAAYGACSRWDAWLMRYRNTRGTGLIEGFCTYDTGMDNSPRWAGIPPGCPGWDAKNCAPIATLPRLCPDLSATVYGARIALAKMATALGKSSDAARWAESAEHIRRLILTKLYVAEDAAFYDLDAQNHFVKVRTCVLTRVCGEHVPDQKLFNDLWTRQIHNPKAFWAPYPLPSIALDDPAFVRPIPSNSWGGASQALTALRAGRWFDHYDRSAEFSTMMDKWCMAIQRDMSFRQQIDPMSGVFTEGGLPNYSPAALVMMDFTWRLAGVREEPEELHWNVKPNHPASQSALFRMRTDEGREAEVRYNSNGASLRFNGIDLGRIESGAARLVTDKHGKPVRLIGISEATQQGTFRHGKHSPRSFTLRANERVEL
jgi:hypothetical protein